MILDPGADLKRFRKALGTFPTGVCIVTTLSREGENVGVTCSSFNSVSLDPPLILWSLGKNAYSLPVFGAAEFWAVHVLGADQEEVSNQFARAGGNKFKDIKLEAGLGEIPLLVDCSTRFQCITEHVYDGGDHVIFVGRVLDFDQTHRLPLVFHSGRYVR
ncbi:flavin reductase family protein [Mesorhizobium loti]|uniref:Flavin reductase n=1 Tax=Mesorhizobium loti R88b TaxID=935548 RepID=A0A6M7WMT9_RHILI|nr:flavin reductase family protein [Mesorhizobium loti]QKD01949.1 flavin reductase [Mesorhizobium loti R88b]